MSQHTAALLARLQHAPAVLVTVDQVQGSGPREEGAWMAVFADAVLNTIGGGHLEFQAIAEARALLQRATDAAPGHDQALVLRYALGPALGQCCGGVVHLRYEHVTAASVATLQTRLTGHSQTVALFGGGHVVLPLLESAAVANGAVSTSDFMAGYGAAQALPVDEIALKRGALPTVIGGDGNGFWRAEFRRHDLALMPRLAGIPRWPNGPLGRRFHTICRGRLPGRHHCSQRQSIRVFRHSIRVPTIEWGTPWMAPSSRLAAVIRARRSTLMQTCGIRSRFAAGFSR